MNSTAKKNTCTTRDEYAYDVLGTIHLGTDFSAPCGSHVQKLRVGTMTDRRSGPRWFVVATHPSAEMWALQNLARQGYDAYLPMIEEERRDPVVKTMRHIVAAPLWPGYVFVQFDMFRENWRPIAHTNGVRMILGAHPEQPTPLPIGIVEAVRDSADSRNIVRTAPDLLPVGVAIAVLSGPFADHRGVCLWSSDTRVRIALTIFGAERQVTVSRRAVLVDGVR